MTTDGTRRLRADARRNRERITTAARTVFAERGTEIPMEEIARAAGVGVGTLYRRFPDRDSLIRAVAHDASQQFLDAARAAADAESDPWRALTEVLFRATELRTAVRLSMVSPRARAILSEDPEFGHVRTELIELLDRLVHAAQENGSLRGDIGSGDLAVILAMVLQSVDHTPDDIRSEGPARYLTLILDGLQAKPGTPLPGRPVTSEDLAAVGGITAQ